MKKENETTKEIESNYDQNSIQVLEELEAVRKRPGMYIGNIDDKGLHHLVWEIIDNSIDEVLANYATKIEVILNPDESITVIDDGRGIPVEIHPKTNVSTLETVFMKLHAGGKFGGDKSGYKVSGGLHGVGASVVNALSEFLEVVSFRNKQGYSILFENGGTKSSGLQNLGETTHKGTKVTFKPDFFLFNEGVDSFNFEIINKRLKENAYLNKNLLIEFTDNRDIDSKKIKYQFKNGLIDFVNYLNKGYELITKDVIYSSAKKEDITVDVALQYTTAYQPKILSFVNNIATIEGGTHVQGFFDAIIRIINKYVKEQLPKKEQEIFVRDDVKEGLTAVISVKHPDPMYEGQTKGKFANIEVRRIVNNIISEQFENYLLENPTQAQLMIAKIKQASKSRLAAQKAKELTRRKDNLFSSTLPGKLADCSSKNNQITELFIVEGDSAGGSAKMGRNREIQAILPLRGKVINAEKSRIDKLFNNNEINALITAIGTGINEDFNLTKIRYGKIIIMTDADVDGSHIRTLLLTFFFRYFRDLIENKHLYIAQPPLYKITKGKSSQYIYTDSEKEKFLSKLEKNTKISIQRYKGLGEMNDLQLWETTMDPSNRKLLLVEIEDAQDADRVFSELMGEIVLPRKQFIEKNALYAKLDY
ncbi:MAG: DNA gyrase subunit B [Candidatus Hepatoplasma scabrum]|nr:MAG: DNA gyrase subunit B [Candidatus Hepatoplasma sp.]